ncbi:MAG: hypothetical protein M1827_006325 [Pycnora praestabilis]|nr:MAG: hypothetical protein M1827_006325 [Pycnora praestabilis]
MYQTTKISSKALASKAAVDQLTRAAYGAISPSSTTTIGLKASCITYHQHALSPSRRLFSSTAKTQLKEYFPPPNDASQIKRTEAAWPHPIYTEQQMKDIKVAHRETENWSDWWALSMCRVFRWGMDMATWYRHDKEGAVGIKDPNTGDKPTRYAMNERKWLVRIIFLETVAGVPGMVGGMLRHLHSLRKMKRDNGWIETLLEEAYNERMHLLTFLQIAEPGRFMKLMILGAQGVFFNGMFVSYLISPRTCHRFVGYLEEEAVLTYTRCIADIDAGKLPKWQKLEAPDIAVRYWNMPEGHRTMKDLLLYVRADEAKHREVNHTLGNLHQNADPNPFVSQYIDPDRPHPSKGIEHIKSTGWDRNEVI